jgi:hypothetical protein
MVRTSAPSDTFCLRQNVNSRFGDWQRPLIVAGTVSDVYVVSRSCLGRVSMLRIQVVTATAATVQGKDMKPRGDQEEVVRSTARMTHCGHGQWAAWRAAACRCLLWPAPSSTHWGHWRRCDLLLQDNDCIAVGGMGFNKVQPNHVWVCGYWGYCILCSLEHILNIFKRMFAFSRTKRSGMDLVFLGTAQHWTAHTAHCLQHFAS